LSTNAQVSAAIESAAQALTAGELVVYPTETLYGLGADAGSEVALERLLAIKGRDAAKGMSVLVSSLQQAAAFLAAPPSPDAQRLAVAFWPGPVTLVLQAADGVSSLLLGPGGGIGLRCPDDPLAFGLLSRFGAPITATSANPSGQPGARSVEEARNYFSAGVSTYIDGGRRDSSQASTVVSLLDGKVEILRQGTVSREAIAAKLSG
jgi:L-threonylcarbamoyladenylate synthase